jgi:hypothetical protein
MILTNYFKLKTGSKQNIKIPNMSHQYNEVPHKLTFYEFENNEEEKVLTTNLNVRLISSAIIDEFTESFFRSYSFISLESFKHITDRGHNIEVSVDAVESDSKTNVKNYILEIEYKSSNGIIFYQNRVFSPENILEEIYKQGHCTELSISFNKPVRNLTLMPKFCVKNETVDWIYPIVFEDNETNSYMIDFTESQKCIYSKYLNFLSLSYDYKEDDDEDHPLKIFVLARGFPK